MKHLIIYLSLYLVSSNIFGQNSLKVEYDIINNLAFTYKTTAILETHNNQSHYIVLKPNNGLKEITIKEENDGIDVLIPESNNRPQVFIDLNTKVLFSYRSMFKKNNLLKESLPIINWEIIDDYKTLSNLNCQKAIGYFRGRKYTVWFSSKIPLPFGPWKLQGLPGLIIEATDDKNQFYFRASKIETKNNLTIANFPSEDNAIELKKFIDEVIPKKTEELESLINSKTDRHTTFSISLPHRHNQKEIIYEWEEK